MPGLLKWLFIVCNITWVVGQPSLAAQNNSLAGDPVLQPPGVQENLPVFYQAAKERLTFPQSWLSGSFTDFSAWRRETRARVRALLLAQPPESDFNTEIIGQEDRNGYVVKKIIFNLTADSRVRAYVLTPKGEGPFPAVLLLHDHGARFDIGKEKMVRPFQEPLEKTAAAQAWVAKLYGNRFIGDELAKRGYVCLAVDALNWGDRGGSAKEEQQALASNLFHLGMSFAGVVAWEDLAAVHFLSALGKVDKKRVAAVGLSFGSFRSWQVAALSDDVAAAVCICEMAAVKELLTPGNNIVKGQSSFTLLHPGLINLLDWPDVAALACPKPLLFYNGEKDQLFPVAAVQPAFEKMRAIWNSQNAGDHLVTQFWPVGHEFTAEMQEQAFDWLDAQLRP